jgi:hypothetical protein
VPAGVTLDLSVTKLAGGQGTALTLADGAVLTVNGTVKAESAADYSDEKTAHGRLRVSASRTAAVINGAGTVALAGPASPSGLGVSGRYQAECLLSIPDGAKLTLTDVTLKGTVNNDHYSYLVYVSGELTMTGNTVITGNGGGGVYVSGGSFTMTGGVIGGNAKNSWAGHRPAGGVEVAGGSFILSGGTVYGSAENLPAGADKSMAQKGEQGASVAGEALWGDGSRVPMDADWKGYYTHRTLTGGSPGKVYPSAGVVQEPPPAPATAEYETAYAESGGIVITKYTGQWVNSFNGPGGSVTIPAAIGGKKVTAIGENAFAASMITKVVIPEGVTEIGSMAFATCQFLTDVVLPKSLTAIRSGAFYYCVKLQNITIPGSVTTVEGGVFIACNNLSEATVTAIVARFGSGPFDK